MGLRNLHGSFTADAAREAIGHLRKNPGAITITSGLEDLRLVVEPHRLALEAEGVPLAGGEAPDLIRGFLCALFWEDATYVVQGAGAMARPGGATIRLDGGGDAVLAEIETGVGELAGLLQQVPGLGAVVTVSGEPPPPGVDTPMARLFRVAESRPRGAILREAADEAGLDPIDAAWGVVDLLEAGMATVKKAAPTALVRRLKEAEGRLEGGLSAGVRTLHLARHTARTDAKRANQLMRQAARALHEEEKSEVAAVCYRQCLNAVPQDVSALEGLVRALTAQGRTAEAEGLRGELVRLYTSWSLPARARAHLEALREPGPEQRELLLVCLLAARDFTAAADAAVALAPTLPAAARHELPSRFLAAGAPPEAVERVVAAAGLRRLRPVRRALVALALLAFLAGGAFAGEIELRRRYQAAARDSRAALDAGRIDDALAPWKALEPFEAAAVVPLSCLATLPALRDELGRLREDRATLHSNLALFRWRDAPDLVQADRGLERLGGQARTDALRALVARTREEIAAYRKLLRESVKELENLVTAGQIRDSFERGRVLSQSHASARDLFAHVQVSVRIRALPDKATVFWAGRALEPINARGEREVRLSIDPLDEGGLLRVVARDHVEQEVLLRFASLTAPQVEIELQPEATAQASGPDFSQGEVVARAEPALSWPEVGAEPGIAVLPEDPGPVMAALVQAGARRELRIQPSDAALLGFADLLGPSERLVVAIRSVAQDRIVRLEGLELFLVDVVSGARATPRRITVGKVDRRLAVYPDRTEVEPLDRSFGYAQVEPAIRAAITAMCREVRR